MFVSLANTMRKPKQMYVNEKTSTCRFLAITENKMSSGEQSQAISLFCLKSRTKEQFHLIAGSHTAASSFLAPGVNNHNGIH